MSKKDYIRIADAISHFLNSTEEKIDLEGLIACFYEELTRDNYRFDIDRFVMYLRNRVRPDKLKMYKSILSK